jgi:hypothetical protein
VLGALHVSTNMLLWFDHIMSEHTNDHKTLMIPVMGYKYNMVGKGNTIHIYMCSEEVLCPVATWQWWTQLTTNMHQSGEPRLPA